MKKIFYLALVFAAVLAVSFGMSHAFHSLAVLAAIVPIMPMSPMGGRLVNRAVKLNDGTWGPGGEVLKWKYYDRIKLASTLTQIDLFKAKVNDTRQGAQLTFADTNIVTAQMPTSQKFTIFDIYFQYLAIAVRTSAQLQLIGSVLRETMARFQIESKYDMFQGTLMDFEGGNFIVHQPAATQQDQGPLTVVSGKVHLEVPIVLQNVTSYGMHLDFITASNAGLDGDFLRFVLDGELAMR